MSPSLPVAGTPAGFLRIIIVVTTITAAVMELLDVTIVNVALTQVAGAIGATIEDVAWVITAYAIANVIIIPLTGFLAEYFGRKNYYLFSIIGFTIASYGCASSTHLLELVGWRFMQGLAGGALLSVSQSILFDAFPPRQRGVAAGIFGMGIVLGPTLGPLLGGLIVDNYHWSYIFYVNVPVGIAAALLTFFFIDKKPGEGQRKSQIVIDYLGIALLAVGVGSLQYVLEKGQADDWFDDQAIRLCCALAVAGLGGFVCRQLTTRHPIVNLRILGRGTLGVTTIFSFVAGLGLFTSVFVYPVLVQRVNGFTPTMTGVSLLWPTLTCLPLFPLIGRRLSAGDSPLPYIIAGSSLFIVFGFYSGTLNGQAGPWDFYRAQVLRVIAVTLLQLPLLNQALAGLSPKDFPAAIALNNMIRQLGGAFGIALANTYVARAYAQHRADLVAHLDPGNPLLVDRLRHLGNSVLQAYRILDLQVDRQAYLLSYLDTFRLVGLFFVLVLPLTYLLRTRKKTAAEIALASKALADAH
ncbi:DHA2 family efflux MFS transporter permease subunit [Hymenobacter sp. BRD67]|uniref:DHA2 family efflux MFS transporter permease subunit n=1 Tax=Hymenobacter sp. BRD67 TaxID=2675877 RepID=UPI0015642145|nr:DHA2 family efflux MFS transporter permease subunit [Hymenobacter sp. BRD67]QKG51474.1 DHA2 family efflux MFS transporter permease subunit [Hymenobacter sp. BRD67]